MRGKMISNNFKNNLTLIISFCLCLVFILPAFGSDEIVESESDKKGIKKGDFLYITVIGHKDLSIDVTVNNEGKITFPLINEIEAEGKTTAQLAIAMETKLAEFIRFPQVTVRHHNSFFVYGEINSPGEHELRGHINILKAITIAGGFTDFGSHKVKIIKSASKKKHIWVNIDRIISGKGNDKNILVEPGDIIVVPESFF